jgi:hypothetical protein
MNAVSSEISRRGSVCTFQGTREHTTDSRRILRSEFCTRPLAARRLARSVTRESHEFHDLATSRLSTVTSLLARVLKTPCAEKKESEIEWGGVFNTAYVINL